MPQPIVVDLLRVGVDAITLTDRSESRLFHWPAVPLLGHEAWNTANDRLST